jgi:hypothetical protein
MERAIGQRLAYAAILEDQCSEFFEDAGRPPLTAAIKDNCKHQINFVKSAGILLCK